MKKKRLMASVGILLSLSFGGQAVAAEKTAVAVDWFSTKIFGSTSPDGITWLPDTGGYAVVDNVADEVFIVDAEGRLLSQFDTVAFGSNNPLGIAYDNAAKTLAIVDSAQDEIFIVDKTGSLLRRCNTSIFAVNPHGITLIPSTGYYAVVDITADEVFIVDANVPTSGDNCIQISSFDTSLFAPNPYDIAYMAATDEYAIVNANDKIYITDSTGSIQDQFVVHAIATSPSGVAFLPDTGNFAVTAESSLAGVVVFDAEGEESGSISTAAHGSDNPQGLTFIPSTGEYAVVDPTDDEVYFFNAGGGLNSHCDTSLYSLNAMGITHISKTGTLALVDTSANKIFEIDSGCNLLREFDLNVVGISLTNASGLGYDPMTNRLVVTDLSMDAAVFIDLDHPGKIQGQFGTQPIGAINVKNTSPSGIAHIDATDSFAIPSNAQDMVFIADRRGILQAQFKPGALTNPTDIAFDSATSTVAVVDSILDSISLYHLPVLSIPKAKPLCLADFDGDKTVDGVDLTIFAGEFGTDQCR